MLQLKKLDQGTACDFFNSSSSSSSSSSGGGSSSSRICIRSRSSTSCIGSSNCFRATHDVDKRRRLLKSKNQESNNEQFSNNHGETRNKCHKKKRYWVVVTMELAVAALHCSVWALKRRPNCGKISGLDVARALGVREDDEDARDDSFQAIPK